MHANDATRVEPGGARFAPETWRISGKFFREIANAQDLLTVKICKRYLCRWHEEKQSRNRICVDRVHIAFQLWQLRSANHAIASDQRRWTNLEITMLTRM